MPGTVLPAAGTPHVEALDTRRLAAGAAGQTLIARRYVLTARAAVAQQRHTHQFGDVLERDRHHTAFGEVAVRGTAGPHTWVAGAAIEHDAYTPRDLPQFAYSVTVPGVFVQTISKCASGCRSAPAAGSIAGRGDPPHQYRGKVEFQSRTVVDTTDRSVQGPVI